MTQGSTAFLWLGASAIAAAVHLVLVQQGLAAYSARNIVPQPLVMPQVEIMAVASSVAGEERSVETAATVKSQKLSATSSAQRATASTAPSVSAVQPVTSARTSAVATAPALSAKPAPKIAAPSVTALAPAATPPSSVMPARPAAPTVATVKSSGTLAAQPTAKVPGLSAPAASVPAAIGTMTVRAASVVASAPAATRVAAALLSPPTTAVQPVASTSAAPPATIAALPQIAPVPAPSLPPAPEVLEQEGIAAPAPALTPQESVLTYQSVLDVLAEMPKAPCFAALPTLSDQSAFQLEVFAQTSDDLDAFADQMEARIGQPPNTTMKPISAAQCAAAAYITEGPSYPRFKLFFEIDNCEIKSGELRKPMPAAKAGATKILEFAPEIACFMLICMNLAR